MGNEEQEDDDEHFEEKMDRLTSELAEMFAKSHDLEDEIRKKLGSIGYEVYSCRYMRICQGKS